MASRLIHYLIAEEIASDKNQIDRDRFVYGALLPDLSLHEDGSYDIAHYGERLIDTRMKGFNWHNFRNKYYLQMGCDSLYLGYYCHLIMDDLWPYNVVIDYLEQAKDLCISELKAFEKGTEFMNPQLLYSDEE